MTIPYTVSV
jgi:hypothetical protein